MCIYIYMSSCDRSSYQGLGGQATGVNSLGAELKMKPRHGTEAEQTLNPKLELL